MPFPIEIDLPPWTVDRDEDFRRWLFGYGADVVLESPAFLLNEYLARCREVIHFDNFQKNPSAKL